MIILFADLIFLIIFGITYGDFCLLSVKLKILPIQIFIEWFFNKFLISFSAINLVFPYSFFGFVIFFSLIFLNFNVGL